MDEKRQIRKKISAQRRALSLSAQKEASRQACIKLQKLWLFQRSQRIAFYSPIKGELSPCPAISAALDHKKQCYLPILDPIKPRQMHFGRYVPHGNTQYNRLGIVEPSIRDTDTVPVWTLDLVISPLVAFDNEGYRLGWGGGYYDTTFSFVSSEPNVPRPWLVGFAYDWQRVDSLPHDVHDIPLDLIVTDHKIYLGALKENEDLIDSACSRLNPP